MTLLAFLLAAAALVATALIASCSLRLRSLPSFLLAAYLIAVRGARPARRGAVPRGRCRGDRICGRSGGAPGRVAVGVAVAWPAAAAAAPELRPSRRDQTASDPRGPRSDRRRRDRRTSCSLRSRFLRTTGTRCRITFRAQSSGCSARGSSTCPMRRPSGSTRYSPGVSWRFSGRSPSSAGTRPRRCRSGSRSSPRSSASMRSRAASGSTGPTRCSRRCSPATLTQVALQSVTTQNDLLSASFVVAAAALVLGRSRAEVRPRRARARARARDEAHGGLRDPASCSGSRSRRLPRRRLAECAAAAVGAFALVGAYGYVLNLVETEGPSVTRPQPSRTDRPRSRGPGPSRPSRASASASSTSPASTPKAVVADSIESAGRSAFDALGIAPNPPETSVEPPFDFAVGQSSNEDISYFGPLGVLLVLPLSLGFTVATIARRERWERLALAARPAADRARDRAHLPLQHLARPFPDHPGPADDAARRRALSPAGARRRGGAHRRRDTRRSARVQRREADGPRRDASPPGRSRAPRHRR